MQIRPTDPFQSIYSALLDGPPLDPLEKHQLYVRIDKIVPGRSAETIDPSFDGGFVKDAIKKGIQITPSMILHFMKPKSATKSGFSLLVDDVLGDCSICLSDVLKPICHRRKNTEDITILDCKHFFHTPCLREWVVRGSNKTCPLCRVPIQKKIK
jgi:hypothetical protein